MTCGNGIDWESFLELGIFWEFMAYFLPDNRYGSRMVNRKLKFLGWCRARATYILWCDGWIDHHYFMLTGYGCDK